MKNIRRAHGARDEVHQWDEAPTGGSAQQAHLRVSLFDRANVELRAGAYCASAFTRLVLDT